MATLQGTSADDTLNGGSGNDSLNGGLGNDLLFGNAGNDTLNGADGSDVIFGGAGNDNLIGGRSGSPNAPQGFFEDFLVGGAGSDTLNGFALGRGTSFERDVLVGGGLVDNKGDITNISGDGVKDLFVLGDAKSSYYISAGEKDFATILGFEKGIDQLQLSPTVNYKLQTASVITKLDTLIFAELPGGNELIAIVANVDLTTK
ncbi:MAG: calcium-binding protein [Nostoc sp. CmiVER01]|uniref:calcium-binding protein n=1 Tax=Nostoc sp. CmiVER01 TaxID=3075384 RepID=UPI002AD42B05|nr:calcium-binding protein [Nostoc sp. CmiVER01]MDZ8124356.1 calcium-binding protein [Nostoc sp. CmiVER01]